MAYIVQLSDPAVLPYLRDLDLSREGRVILYNMLHSELRVHADVYINDPTRRLTPGSDCFRVDLLFRDPVRRITHNLQLIINDSGAQYGVLRIDYAEDFPGPANYGQS